MTAKDKEHLWAEAMRAERRGDAAAYERLLRDIAELLRRLIQHRLAQFGLGAHNAEDLVQDVLIGLHTKRHTWDAARPFLPWLYAITRYKLVDAARGLKREAQYRIDLTFEELSDIIEAPADDHDRAMLDIDRHLSKSSAYSTGRGACSGDRWCFGSRDGTAAQHHRRRGAHDFPSCVTTTDNNG